MVPCAYAIKSDGQWTTENGLEAKSMSFYLQATDGILTLGRWLHPSPTAPPLSDSTDGLLLVAVLCKALLADLWEAGLYLVASQKTGT